MALALACHAAPKIDAVLNGASFAGNLAPGMWAAVFGTELASSAASTTTVPLPTTLQGVSVTVAGIAAPLFYVSPTQINMIIPFEVTTTGIGGSVPVVVKTAGSSSALNVTISRNSPGLFSLNGSGAGAALAFDANFKPATALSNQPIVLYAAGLGQTSPAASSSSGGPSSEPLSRTQDAIEVYVGERKASVLYAGLAPGLPGIYQLNVTPDNPASDRIYVRVNGWQSNTTTLPLPASANVSNIVGSIDGLYPATGENAVKFGALPTPPSFQFSAAFVAAEFKVSFDIAPNAKPFSIVGTSEGGTSIINIDPTSKTWRATVSSPIAAVRSGLFANTELTPVLDFLTCDSGVCRPFPVNTIPQSRLDPVAFRALLSLPLPDSFSGNSATGLRMASGTFTGTHFDSADLGSLQDFGGYFQISHAGSASRKTPFRLYVDGRLVASTDAPYSIP